MSKFRLLRLYLKSKYILTKKKYFFFRHSFVLGFIIVWVDKIREPNGIFSLFNNVWDIILVPAGWFILGYLVNAFAYVLADAFVKEKAINDIDFFKK